MMRVFRALVVAGLALAGSLPAIAAPRDPVLDRAKAIRESNPDAAERIVQGVLARSPNDYYALYNLGLVEYSRAANAPEGPDRLVHYRQSATWLERASAVRVAQNAPDATIFNSLGVVYLATGDLARAHASFADGIRNQALLTHSSLGKLYANIGYLFWRSRGRQVLRPRRSPQERGWAILPPRQTTSDFGSRCKAGLGLYSRWCQVNAMGLNPKYQLGGTPRRFGL